MTCFRLGSSYDIFSFGGLSRGINFFPQNELIIYCLKTIHRVRKVLCLRLFLFFQHPYLDIRYRYRQHRGMTQSRLIYYGTLFTYIRKRSDSKIDSCGTPQFISPTSEKTFSSVTKKFLFERYD